jgi:hypothetical protein
VPIRHSSVRVAAIAVIAAAVVAWLVADAPADPKKPYTVVVESPQQAGATDSAYTVTLTNKAAHQKLGSANLTVPAAFTIVGGPSTSRGTVSREGNLLKLRNLELPNNGSVTVTLGLQMPCAPGDYAWAVQAKQSNEFRGEGNDMGPVSGTLSTRVEGGGCRLRFVAQPAAAERNTRIRAVEFQPTSPRLVAVEVVDGSGNRVTSFTGTIELRLIQSGPGTLTPNPASSTAVAGLATFSNLSIDRSGEYNLRATTPVSGFAPAVSEEFKIIDVVEPCTASSCTATLAGTNTTSTVTGTGGSGTGFVLLSLDLGPRPVCAGYSGASADWYEFETTVSRDKTVTATFSKTAMAAFGKPASKLQICFAAPIKFPAKDGRAQPFDYDGDPANGAEGFVGLLPDCTYKPAPCVLKRESTGHDHHRGGGGGGGAIVKFFVPASWGDPRYRG